MAFSPILNQAIEAGEPVTKDLWKLVQTDLDDHEVRILTLEGSVGLILPIQMDLYGRYDYLSDKIGVAYTRVTDNVTVNAGRVMAHTAGTSGTTEIDIQFKRGVAAFKSLFTALPAVAFGAGNLGIGSGTLDPSEVNLVPGDILRLDLSTSQVEGNGFSGFLEITKT